MQNPHSLLDKVSIIFNLYQPDTAFNTEFEQFTEVQFISHIIQHRFAEKFWFRKIEIQTLLGGFEDAQYRASLQEWQLPSYGVSPFNIIHTQ